MLEAPKPLPTSPLVRQDTQGQAHVQQPGGLAKALSVSCVWEGGLGWLPSISAVYVGNVGTELLGEDI